MSDFATDWCPTPPAEMTTEWRQNVAQFGDGYEQRELDGINALNRRWRVEYATRPQDVIQAMDAYLVAIGARAFPFREPATGQIFQVFCDGWTVEWNLVRFYSGGGRLVFGSLSADFRKANGVGA